MNQSGFSLKRFRTTALVTFAIFASFGAAIGQTTKVTLRHPVEGPDFALRRAQAFHDMYAEPEAKAALANAQKAFRTFRVQRAALPAGRALVRPLPVSYPNRNLNERLRILTEIAPTRIRTGNTIQMMMPKAIAVTGSNWRNIGPTNSAGRVSALAVDPTNTSIIYRGTAGGGLWKSEDGGTSWAPLTDTLGNLSIGVVAIAPSNPQIVYVGTGEGALGIDGIDGIGFISSVDGGTTWALPTEVIAAKFFALSVHPTNPKEILAATSTGLQKSTDGGATWATTLSKGYGTALARVPGNPATVLATVWDLGAQDSSGLIYRSTDSGNTWKKVGGAGIAPFKQDTGRLSLAIAPSAPTTVYALAASAAGDIKDCDDDPVDQVGFYRSTNGGQTWTFRDNPVSGTCPTASDPTGFDSILAGQGWYANSISVSPTNANVLYAGGLDLWTSTDGAKTWHKKSHWDIDPSENHYVHADIHALTWAGSELLIGDDGGMSKADSTVATFAQLNTGIVTRQYYSVGVSAINRDLVIGGAQDNGTNIRIGATTTYQEVIGGDGFASAVDSSNPKILYGTLYNSRILKSTDGGANFDEITPNFGQNEKLPFISPLTMDPANPKVLYTGSNFLWKTSDGGVTWARTSNTILSDDPDIGYVTKIAVSRSDSRNILTATGSGAVSKSSDSGVTWTRLQGLPAGYASDVEFDPKKTTTFYVCYTTSSGAGHAFKTTNGGTSFTRIDMTLPTFPIHVLRVDPGDTNTLYAGTDVGLYRSTDGGTHWAKFGAGLPAVSIWDIALLPDDSMMRIATHGRGFFELQITSH